MDAGSCLAVPSRFSPEVWCENGRRLSDGELYLVFTQLLVVAFYRDLSGQISSRPHTSFGAPNGGEI